MDVFSFFSKNITYVIVAFSILVTIFTFSKDKIKDEEGKKYKRLNFGVFFLSVLIILFSLVEKSNSETELAKAKNEKNIQHILDSLNTVRIISIKDTVSKSFDAVNNANTSLDSVKSKTLIILSNIDSTISLQNTSKNILKSQINSSETLLKINKELLRTNTNDDSLILIFPPGRNGDFITFYIFNSGYYPIQNVEVNYPNRNFVDSVTKIKEKEKTQILSFNEDSNWRIFKYFDLLPRQKKEIYFYKVEKIDSVYTFNFDVNYQKTNLTFSYTVKLSDKTNELIILNQLHQNIRNGKKFVFFKSFFPNYFRSAKN